MANPIAEQLKKICDDDNIKIVFVALAITYEYKDLKAMNEVIEKTGFEHAARLDFPGYFGVTVTQMDREFVRLLNSGKLLIIYGDGLVVQYNNDLNLSLMAQLEGAPNKLEKMKQLCNLLKLTVDTLEENEIREALKRPDVEIPEDILYFENGIEEARDFFDLNIFFGSYEVVVTVEGGVRMDELNDFTEMLTEKFGQFSHIHMVFDNIDDALKPCRITILTCPKGPNYSGFTEDKEDDFEE